MRSYYSSERRWGGHKGTVLSSEVTQGLHTTSMCCFSLASPWLMNVTKGEGGGRGWREMEQKCKAAISDIICLSPDRLAQKRWESSTRSSRGSAGAEGTGRAAPRDRGQA